MSERKRYTLNQRITHAFVYGVDPVEEQQRADDLERLRLDVEVRRSDEQVAHGFTARQIRAAAHEVRLRFDRHPTQVEVATALHTSEATLKRASKELRMGRWPPAPPKIDPA